MDRGSAAGDTRARRRRGERTARDLARFVTALQMAEVPAEAASNPQLRSYRAGALSNIDAEIRQHLDECRALPDLPLDVDACLEVWTQADALPVSPGAADRWVHADLLGENLLLRDGRLAAVLDFGGLGAGDPSVDLVVAWEVLEPQARQVFRSAVDIDDATWLRGRAWALAIAVMTLPYYWNSLPARCAARLRMAEQVLADHQAEGGCAGSGGPS